jgi:hypothetical protein
MGPLVLVFLLGAVTSTAMHDKQPQDGKSAPQQERAAAVSAAAPPPFASRVADGRTAGRAMAPKPAPKALIPSEVAAGLPATAAVSGITPEEAALVPPSPAARAGQREAVAARNAVQSRETAGVISSDSGDFEYEALAPDAERTLPPEPIAAVHMGERKPMIAIVIDDLGLDRGHSAAVLHALQSRCQPAGRGGEGGGP